MNQTAQPGRLGVPDMTLLDDYRLDPRIRSVLAAMGTMGDGIEPVSPQASYADCVAYCGAFETLAAQAHPMMFAAMPEFPSVTTRTETIKGVDGNDIPLYLHLPEDPTPGPCVVHTHGGGMVMMMAADPGFVLWRQSLAAKGIRVVGVEFRNGGGELGDHPFPAGLNDCASAVQWVTENKEALGITSVVVSGESGGGNLAIATTLKAKQEGWLEQIDGVYACCPYIYGDYLKPMPALTSLVENNGYAIDRDMMAVMVKVYDPDHQHMGNPLAWPFHADKDLLAGLPPHVVSVNELDPLRDEGLEFYRKLLAAGVTAMARTVHGTPHAGDLSYSQVAPDLFGDTLSSVVRFCQSV